MTTVIVLLAVAALGAALVRYARHDRFAGPISARDLRGADRPSDDLRHAYDLMRFVPR